MPAYHHQENTMGKSALKVRVDFHWDEWLLQVRFLILACGFPAISFNLSDNFGTHRHPQWISRRNRGSPCPPSPPWNRSSPPSPTWSREIIRFFDHIWQNCRFFFNVSVRGCVNSTSWLPLVANTSFTQTLREKYALKCSRRKAFHKLRELAPRLSRNLGKPF